ncbi:hypothetical protein CCP3SC15_150014 [Gammaproteobacteria bacterium]
MISSLTVRCTVEYSKDNPVAGLGRQYIKPQLMQLFMEQGIVQAELQIHIV